MSIWKLIYDLEYWIQIGIGEDILNSPDSRPEFQHLIERLKAQNIERERIPGQVVVLLKQEAKLAWYKRRTFWVMLKVALKKAFRC